MRMGMNWNRSSRGRTCANHCREGCRCSVKRGGEMVCACFMRSRGRLHSDIAQWERVGVRSQHHKSCFTRLGWVGGRRGSITPGCQVPPVPRPLPTLCCLLEPPAAAMAGSGSCVSRTCLPQGSFSMEGTRSTIPSISKWHLTWQPRRDLQGRRAAGRQAGRVRVQNGSYVGCCMLLNKRWRRWGVEVGWAEKA
jgi:hypothetical protein